MTLVVIVDFDVVLRPKTDIVHIDDRGRRRPYNKCVDAGRRLGRGRPIIVLVVAALARYLVIIPLTIVVERVEDVLTVWIDEVDPRLPQRMNNVVDKAHLQITQQIALQTFVHVQL